jgi:exonuclease SbcD
MRILHFADVHIGVENYGKTDPDTGLSTRLTDFLATFDEIVTYALDTRVDLVLFCGDAYKSRDPSQTHQREFASRIARMASEDIPVFLLIGNHDTPHVSGRATAVEIFRTLDVSRVVIGDAPRTYRIETPAGPIQIVAVPWIRRSAFLAGDETRGLTPQEINVAIEDRLTRIVRNQADQLDPTVPAVLAGHVTVSQATTGSEQSMMLGRDHVLVNSGVALPEFEYVALGHIHRHQVLGHDPKMVYSGSLQRVDFGEERDEKGFCVVDLDPTKMLGTRLVDFEFRRVDARRFVTVEARVRAGDLDPTATVVTAISAHDVDDAVVRVQITVPGELEGHLNESQIRNALQSAHFVASISREVLDRKQSRLGTSYSKGIDAREALKLYLQSRKVPDDRSQVLMRRAEELLEEHGAE